MGSRCFSPPSPPTSGKPCPGITTCMSKHQWQRQNLSCVPISFLQRALGSSCPCAPPCCPVPPSITSHRPATGWGPGLHPRRVSSHLVPTSIHHRHAMLPTKGLLYFWLLLKTSHWEKRALGGSAGRGPAVLAPSAPNGLAPKAGTRRDVTLSSGHDICVSKAVNTDAIPSPVPLLPEGDGFATRFSPHSIWGGGGKDGGGVERFCARTTYLFF